MNLSQRNTKVALARWKKIRAKEKAMIKRDNKAHILKSAIMGFLAGDGTVEKRRINSGGCHYEVRLFADDKEMIDTYIRAIEFVYNKKPKVSFRDKFFTSDSHQKQSFLTY